MSSLRAGMLLMMVLVALPLAAAASAEAPIDDLADDETESLSIEGEQADAGQATDPDGETPSDTETANGPEDSPDKQPAGRDGLGRDEPGKEDPAFPDPGDMLRKMMASLLVVLVLAVAAWVVFRKVLPRVGHPGGRNVTLMETTYVGPRKAVHLLKVGQRRFLVGSSQEGLRLLADVTDAVDDDSRATPGETEGDAS